MEKDVRRYFKDYLAWQGGRDPGLTRTANQLHRGGISTMDTLCRLLEQEPDRVLQIRNIGAKSVELAREVCTAYRREQAVAGEKTRPSTQKQERRG